jgi:hypothetical protein
LRKFIVLLGVRCAGPGQAIHDTHVAMRRETWQYTAVSREAWAFLRQNFGGGPAAAVWGIKGPNGEVALEPLMKLKVGLWRSGGAEHERVFHVSRGMRWRMFRKDVLGQLYSPRGDSQGDFTLCDWIGAAAARDLDAEAETVGPAATLEDLGVQVQRHCCPFVLVAASCAVCTLRCPGAMRYHKRTEHPLEWR